MQLVLASSSSGRLRVLRDAGFRLKVDASGVDESHGERSTASAVQLLAERKAEAVASRYSDAVVVGCDSMLDLDGEAIGKPPNAAHALALWRRLRGREAVLFTGHSVIDTATGRRAGGLGATVIRFGHPSDAELEAYVATGEPLALAAGFSLEGRSAPFLTGIDGDASNVIGLSLPVFRQLLSELGFAVTDFWAGTS